MRKIFPVYPEQERKNVKHKKYERVENMKKFKKFAAAMLACIFALSMSMTAMAATITIEGNEGHTYKAYQILTGTLKDGVMTEVVWGDGVNATGTTALGDAAVYAETLTTQSDARKMARTFVDNGYLSDTNATASTYADGTYTIEVAETGYYLITDTVADGSDESASAYIVKLVEGDTVEASPKGNVPVMEKKVVDINDSTDTAYSSLQDSADYDIGDTVTFTITVALPEEYSNYASYYMAITDHLSDGLDLVAGSFKLYYNNGGNDVEITDTTTVGAQVVYADDGAGGNDTNHFKYAIADLKNIAEITNGTEIILTYDAVLNSEAVIGAEGNPNTASLTYQNDPTYAETFEPTAPSNTPETSEDGSEVYNDEPDTPVYDDEDDDGTGDDGKTPGDEVDTDPSNPAEDTDGDGKVDPEYVQAETPDDTVIVFTYELLVDKVDEEGAPLAGAAFTLYKQEADADSENNAAATACDIEGYTDYYSVAEYTADGVDTTFTFQGLDDGNYLLVETTTPEGYNSIDPIEFKVTAGHQTTSDDPQLESITINNTAFAGDAATGQITTDVVNESGVELPETGGIGTTIFYVLGAVLVIGAGVLLVTKKRMENK